jgi:acetyltransferase
MHLQKNALQYSRENKKMDKQLHSFLNPKNVAIIGASSNPTKRGFQAIKKLQEDGFEGDIYPINPKTESILGINCFKSIKDVPCEVDFALICTPSKTLPAILEDCGAKGVKGGVVLAGGFSETGEDGKKLEKDMVDAAKRNNIRLIGPNTSGMFNLHKKLNPAGLPGVKEGNLGVLTQSGNMALSLVTEGQINGHVGFSSYIGVGNQADLRFDEYLEYFAEDENTNAVMMYVEGFKDGQAFIKSAREVTKKKPVVVFKSGKTAAGQKSASSHTGALAGSYEMTKDLLLQSGITLIERSDALLPVAETLSLQPVPKGNKIAILADGGGHATMTTDSCIKAGMEMAELSEETKNRLREVLFDQASVANPIDLAGSGDADVAVFEKCTKILLEDGNVDGLIIVGLFGGYAIRFSETLYDSEIETSHKIAEYVKKYNKPVILQSLYTPLEPKALVELRNAGVPTHESCERTVECMAALVDLSKARARNKEDLPSANGVRKQVVEDIIKNSPAKSSGSVLEGEARAILREYDICVSDDVLITSEADLAKCEEVFGDKKLALKISSKDILHKSDAGGVKLNVPANDVAELKAKYNEILANAKKYDANAEISGVLASPMSKPGVEVIIGVMNDPIYGPTMMFGLGGIFVEVLKDVTFRSLPLSKADAKDMISSIKAKKILDGVRGAKAVDKEALVDLLTKISDLVLGHPEISEMDFNPVIVRSDGYEVVDARMILPKE